MIRAVRMMVMAIALALTGLPALAHQLSVFARMVDGTVQIEVRFADGTPVMAGDLTVRDAGGTVLHTAPLDGSLPVLWPLGDLTGEGTGGLRIDVDAGGGHTGYWLLTPADLSGDGG